MYRPNHSWGKFYNWRYPIYTAYLAVGLWKGLTLSKDEHIHPESKDSTPLVIPLSSLTGTTGFDGTNWSDRYEYMITIS